MFDIFHEALETAILSTLKWCCLTCDGGGNEPNPEDRCHCVALFETADYSTIISQIGDIECGDFNFPLDVRDKKHSVFWHWWDKRAELCKNGISYSLNLELEDLEEQLRMEGS